MSYSKKDGQVTLTKGERAFLQHMRKPWWNVANKRSFCVFFGTDTGRQWTPRGPTGSTVASLMKKGILDFAPKPGTIGKVVRTR